MSALGALLLAISVFLPWYGVSFTAGGLAYTQKVGNQVASQYGNATLQSYMSSLHTTLSGYVGHDFVSLSAHQALKTLSVVMLIAAALGCAIALFALAGSAAAEANRGALALLGAVAGACVLYRMVAPPTPAGELLALSLREGAWLALIGAAAMVVGALWPARLSRASSRDGDVQDAWSGLSGWTPEA
ncbi:MAG TPA: hypothetical protein VHT25_02715 [Solirubrobacteraceae bacterium]|nr:hypothetical protein [Solirubrobacteraceae bacterium]